MTLDQLIKQEPFRAPLAGVTYSSQGSWYISGVWAYNPIIGFHLKNPLEGYRRLTFMMLDADIVGGEPDQRLAGSQPGGTVVEVERQAVEEGRGV